MTFTITVAQRKGGAGKTTICCHLAAALAERGLKVAAIDLDDQQSLTRWARRRLERRGLGEVALDGATSFSLAYRVRKLRSDFDVILIDTPPTTDRCVAQAVRESDLAIAPLQLSPLDLDASLPTAQLIGAALKPSLFVINRAPPRARIADLIREKIREFRLPVAKTEIGSRAAFAESLASGRTAIEIEPSGPAAMEIRMLTEQVIDLAGIRLRAA